MATNDRQKQVGLAERVLLSLTPDEPAPASALPPGAGRIDSRDRRVGLALALLAERPALRAELEREAKEAWERHNGDAAAFISALAERREQVLSQAELEAVAQRMPAAVAESVEELIRYLTEVQGTPGFR
jgi:hypothetical protein